LNFTMSKFMRSIGRKFSWVSDKPDESLSLDDRIREYLIEAEKQATDGNYQDVLNIREEVMPLIHQRSEISKKKELETLAEQYKGWTKPVEGAPHQRDFYGETLNLYTKKAFLTYWANEIARFAHFSKDFDFYVTEDGRLDVGGESIKRLNDPYFIEKFNKYVGFEPPSLVKECLKAGFEGSGMDWHLQIAKDYSNQDGPLRPIAGMIYTHFKSFPEAMDYHLDLVVRWTDEARKAGIQLDFEPVMKRVQSIKRNGYRNEAARLLKLARVDANEGKHASVLGYGAKIDNLKGMDSNTRTQALSLFGTLYDTAYQNSGLGKIKRTGTAI